MFSCLAFTVVQATCSSFSKILFLSVGTGQCTTSSVPMPQTQMLSCVWDMGPGGKVLHHHRAITAAVLTVHTAVTQPCAPAVWPAGVWRSQYCTVLMNAAPFIILLFLLPPWRCTALFKQNFLFFFFFLQYCSWLVAFLVSSLFHPCLSYTFIDGEGWMDGWMHVCVLIPMDSCTKSKSHWANKGMAMLWVQEKVTVICHLGRVISLGSTLPSVPAL